MNFGKQEIKAGIYGFVFVLLACMFALKPYLGRAIIHNFATVYDYKFFDNRVVKAAPQGLAWSVASKPFPAPSAETAKLLANLKTTAVLMLEDGKIAYENYSEDGGPNTLSGSFSMAKSIVGLLYGFALEDRKIKSLEDPISRYFPEWSEREEGKITLKQLLTMSSGLNWDESYWNPFSITCESYYGGDLLKTALKQRLEKRPGTEFEYLSGSTELLGLALSRALNESLASYASRKLWVPLMAEHDALWSLDREEGNEKAFCCFNATARDFARIGELVRNGGMFNGKQLVGKDYVRAMTAPHMIPNYEGKPTDYYGYQWWILQTPKGPVPYARGILGQYIVVIPQKNRVVVRLGKKTGERTDHHPVELRALVEWALQ